MSLDIGTDRFGSSRIARKARIGDIHISAPDAIHADDFVDYSPRRRDSAASVN